MLSQQLKNVLAHPLFGAQLTTVFRLAMRYGISPQYTFRFCRVLLFCALNSPFQLYEKHRYDEPLHECDLETDPLFIVGHWRSGTTHLHNLLIQDHQFAYLSTLQALFPNEALIKSNVHKFLLDALLPDKRPMDQMNISATMPAEEEVALACMGDLSIFNGMWFPSGLQDMLNEYVLFKGDPYSITRWKKAYTELVCKISTLNHNKPLVLKNPANTARIQILLELYPNAKFIHIHRNPYEIFMSTAHLYRKLMEHRQFQKVNIEFLEQSILDIYSKIMKQFIEQKRLLPAGQLIEIRYEDLIKTPLDVLSIIYDQLDIKGFNEVKSEFQQYIDTTRNSYRPNNFQLTKDIQRKVEKHWSFAFSHWNYAFIDT